MSEHGQHEIEHMVDHISNLPDCILHHILSFMPTKQVVKTSILSTRWRNLWVYIPTLDFGRDVWRRRGDDDRFKVSFMNFVERVFHSQQSALNIEKLRISCFRPGYTSEIRSCISSAIMRNVKELDWTHFGDPFVIPRSLCDNTSLVVLKLRSYCASDLPSYVSFPCLKVLQLCYKLSTIRDYIEKLLSGCPVLEELVFTWCEPYSRNNRNNTMISCPTLKSLTVYDIQNFNYIVPGFKMEINAPNLTCFEYTGYRSNKILLKNVSSLVKACIRIPFLHLSRLKKHSCPVVDLLKQLRYVVSLSLSNSTLQSLTRVGNIQYPVFENLTHLMVTMHIPTIHTFRVMMGLLSFCPVLQDLGFTQGFSCIMQLEENNSVWSSIPACISNCLKTVAFEAFHGYDSEICFLKCVLKHACVLERINVRWSKTSLRGDLKRKTEEVGKELEKIERRSTACVINFS